MRLIVWQNSKLFRENKEGADYYVKKYKDFIEIKVKANNRQYRLIGKRVNRDILLVGWGFHDGKGWHTELTPATAQERAVQMMDTPAKYRREHEL